MRSVNVAPLSSSLIGLLVISLAAIVQVRSLVVCIWFQLVWPLTVDFEKSSLMAV
jgi:hypothetical protein